ncbi:PHB depolymerase family esterase [Massilia sp. YIM B02763]|uniref:extracellular catalytic domain type 1 short-chain-length polyhydroxyalkanoate depolymerase n=1 Tax=Massilia sp. YIM B02763 TaxID=3050130 RepID=UPI0025B6ADEB|nr:PHB depolymerase family esterase [Massilia sp. YIM B02763]MDN4053820.1 PHB depolymerase family esterase [Massilia sp. YIM B02763]
MSISSKFLAQMRAATRSMMRRGPSVARSVIRESVKNATAMQAAAARATPPAPAPAPPPVPPSAPASNQPAYDPVSDMLATLSRFGQPGGNPFNVPPLSSGAAAIGLPGHFIDASYSNDAGTREYKLYVPSTYAGQARGEAAGRAAPLLVMLHGCKQNPDDFALGTGMNLVAEEQGCLVAYPAQSQQANPSRCWNWFNAVDQQRGQGEPALIAGITRDIMARYAVDPDQVYVAGLSAGGAMAAIMGTLYPDLYAAVGVHSGLPFAAAHDLPTAMAAMKGDFRTRHTEGKALPIIVFHGDRDTTVHPVNGDALIAARRRDPADIVVVEPGTKPDGHAFTRTVHRLPDGAVHAEHWVVHGSGHAWSGGDARGSYTDGKGPDASREMMRFFRTAR